MIQGFRKEALMNRDHFWLTGAHATCLHSSFVIFAAAGVERQTPFPSIAEHSRFICTRCGGRAVSIMPDWRGIIASGIGR